MRKSSNLTSLIAWKFLFWQILCTKLFVECTSTNRHLCSVAILSIAVCLSTLLTLSRDQKASMLNQLRDSRVWLQSALLHKLEFHYKRFISLVKSKPELETERRSASMNLIFWFQQTCSLTLAQVWTWNPCIFQLVLASVSAVELPSKDNALCFRQRSRKLVSSYFWWLKVPRKQFWLANSSENFFLEY